MLSYLKKSVLAATLITLAPVAPAMFGTASDASAHTYVSGSITFGAPAYPVPVPVPQVAVIGFSYGNPYLYGPVYTSPELCSLGQVYYYPTYHVWAPYHAGYRYYNYSQPRYYHRGPYIRGHAYGHSYGSYSHGYSGGYNRGGGSYSGRSGYSGHGSYSGRDGRRGDIRGHQ